MVRYPNVKINLGLNILRKRDDGFHDLETVFLPYFGICDTLEIIKGDDYSEVSAHIFADYSASEVAQSVSEDGSVMITIAARGGIDWDPLSDLCCKAYRLLAEDFNLGPVKIFLEKKSPVGAGLGGGSSDAAFTLKILNELFSLDLSDSSMASYAARLGSDCAFFIYNIPMFGEGRGEILSPMDMNDFFEHYELQVVAPEGVPVSTAQAYKSIVPAVPSCRLRDAIKENVENWQNIIVNDFEAGVFADYPQLKTIKQSLYDSGAVYASMSGSGSALFAIYKKQ